MASVRVRLTKKLAPLMNGVDLRNCEVGEIVMLPNAQAENLIREGWAEPVDTPDPDPSKK